MAVKECQSISQLFNCTYLSRRGRYLLWHMRQRHIFVCVNVDAGVGVDAGVDAVVDASVDASVISFLSVLLILVSGSD